MMPRGAASRRPQRLHLGLPRFQFPTHDTGLSYNCVTCLFMCNDQPEIFDNILIFDKPAMNTEPT